MLFYNKEIFAEAGLPDRAPQPGACWKSTAKQITKDDKAGIAKRGNADNRAIIYTGTSTLTPTAGPAGSMTSSTRI
jgi:ABC-type glycerol-3-phosphate transport system substrate-binding protein